jgi:hypothetical protein
LIDFLRERRIWLIEFLRSFSEEEMDRDLESKLVKELSGIFHRAIDSPNSSRSPKPFFRIETSSIYSEVLDQETCFWVYGREFLSFTYQSCSGTILGSNDYG